MNTPSSDSKDRDAPPTRLLRVSSQLVQVAGVPPVIQHAKVRVPVPFNDEAWGLLEQFRVPASPESVLERLGVTGEARLLVAAAIRRFIEAALLVEPDEVEYLHRNYAGLTASHRASFVPV